MYAKRLSVDRREEEPMSRCENCGQSPLPPRNRRYCTSCSPLASRLRKREYRARDRQKIKDGLLPRWSYQDFKCPEDYRAYYRNCMRRRRAALRERRIEEVSQ